MRLPHEQLASRLSKNLAPLYTIFGAEPLLALEAADRIRAAARTAGYVEREVLTVETGFKWNELGMSAASLSLFGAKKILEVRIPTGKPGVEGAKALEAFAAALPEDTVSLVLLPEIDRAGQSTKWFQALDASSVTIEAQPVARDRLPDWIGQRLSMQEQRASRETLEFIADRVEGNLLAAFQEVQKLALIFPTGELSLDQVSNAVVDVSRYDVFHLGDAILEGNVPRVVRMLEGLEGEGEAPPLILWAVSAEIRALLAVAIALRSRKPITQQMQREYRLWGGRQAKVERAARKHDIGKLEAALIQCQKIDRMIKGLVRGDVWDALLQLALLAAGKPALQMEASLG
ncbi:MAG: DNA polymerase III subunit delta [Pseudomonadota bacterium]